MNTGITGLTGISRARHWRLLDDGRLQYDHNSVTTRMNRGGEYASERKKPGKAEVLFVTVSALAAFTFLLLRLPYRAPVVNSLLTAFALSSLYSYLRLRLNIRVPFSMLLCLVFSVVIDIIGNQYGLFSRSFALIPYDIITHFASGTLGLVFVMWLLMALLERLGHGLTLGFIAFFSATTTFSLAAYYEITELMDERLLGGHRMWNPRDTAQDLAADLAGIIIAAVAYSLVIRRKKAPAAP